MSALKKLTRETAGVKAKRQVKVIQFGEGNFLRAFVDWMIDLLNEKAGFNGDVQVVQPLTQGMGEMINNQEGLYHVTLNGIRHGQPVTEDRLITCVTGVINPYADYEKFLALGENPDLEFVVSNTTEAGIAFVERDTSFETTPSSFPGKLTALLFRRFEHFRGDPAKGVVLLPCELIDKNGDNLKDAVLRFATAWRLPEAFASWLKENNLFCNTLVDRIVPGFPRDTITEVQARLGFADNLVVMAEPFHLWVIETPVDLTRRLPVQRAGLDVKFVKDQSPYRTRKVRILNGAHTAIVALAYLRGLRTVSEAVHDTYMKEFLQEALNKEIIPVLDLPAEELRQFSADVLERFQNPFIRHELMSIALNSISKFKVRVLPSLMDYLKIKGSLPPHLVQAFAGLILFYRGEWGGSFIPLADTPDVLQFMRDAWSSHDPGRAVSMTLSNATFWGQDLTLLPGLENGVHSALTGLMADPAFMKA